MPRSQTAILIRCIPNLQAYFLGRILILKIRNLFSCVFSMVAITSEELNCYIRNALLTDRYRLTLSDSCRRMTLGINPSGPTLFILVSVQCWLVKPETIMCQIQADILGQDIKNVQYSLYIILHNFLGVLCNKIVTAVKRKVKCTVVQALRLCTGRMAHRGNRGIGKGKVHRCTGSEALYRPYGP